MPTVQEEMMSPLPNNHLPSTPASDFISPTTKRHRGFAANQSPMLRNVLINDDAEERKQRRRSKVLEMQRSLESPVATPGDRRRISTDTSTLSNVQVTEHYSNCIKLSAENKINAKNAFHLHLIDYMSDLIKKKEKDGGMTNFQVASCTLDASAKIYAGRVDSIHADAYKMLGGLGRDSDKRTEGDGPGVGDDDDDDDLQKKKKHKRMRKKNTIETNLNNIKGNHLQMDFEVDPLFQQTSAEFDEGGTSGLLLNHLCFNDDECQLLLDSNSIANLSTLTYTKDDETSLLNVSDIKAIYKSLNFDKQICAEFAGFEFTNWNDTDEDTMTNMLSKMSNHEHAFDMTAIPEPIDDMSAQDLPPDVGGCDFSDDEDMGGDGCIPGGTTENIILMADDKEAQMAQNAQNKIITDGTIGELCLQLASEPTEYSYFNLDMLTTWAGPEHWKLKPKPRDSSSHVSDKKRKDRKAYFKIDFDEDINFDKLFTVTKVTTTLTKTTVEKWRETAITLPADLHYNPDNLFRLFGQPKVMVKRQAETETENESLDDDIENYNYENENDCNNFCPSVEDDDEIDGMSAGGSDISQNTNFQNSFGVNESVFDASLLQGDHLVAQPHKVARIDIQYARTAKKMDVKKLKYSMWNILTTAEETENTALNGMSEKTSVAGKQSFKDLYSVLPAKISTTMAKNLSIPMCFVCLLHLANEKTLKIEDIETFSDLIISQDSF
uniref:Condensin complex subunit 2 n=1 Tax=Saccoglossus kowalevskii TaxID=10224 RepID=A0ABM0N114_SACKO|nr:PREDICTED: condensin complex subunit 2-like [Saccoglossus kowalevskii]